MTKNQLFTALNKLCTEMDDSYNINCGGCCFVAACLAYNLEKINIPFKVIHYNEYSCHYAIKVSDRYINRSGYSKEEISEVIYDGSEFLFCEYENKDWNPMYNRKWNLIVSVRIRKLFRKYENSRT